MPRRTLYRWGTSCDWLNSLWLSDAIWQHRSGSTLAQVMACCLTAPSHCLNQCCCLTAPSHYLNQRWLTVTDVCFVAGFHLRSISQWVSKLPRCIMNLKIILLNSRSYLPRVTEFIQACGISSANTLERQCSAVITRSNSSQIHVLTRDILQLTREDEIWGICCEFKVWFMFSHCQRRVADSAKLISPRSSTDEKVGGPVKNMGGPIKLLYITMFKIGKSCRKLIFGSVKHAKFFWCLNLIHKSHNTPVPNPTKWHSEQKCAQLCFERCQCWKIPQVHGWQLWRRTSNFLLIFL